MGWRYYGNRNYKKGGGFNWSLSKFGLNTSWTFDLGFFKWNIPFFTSRKRKSRVTLKGSGIFRLRG